MFTLSLTRDEVVDVATLLLSSYNRERAYSAMLHTTEEEKEESKDRQSFLLGILLKLNTAEETPEPATL